MVTVPARNEGASIEACLRSIDRAAGCTPLPVLVVVAADCCLDDTVVRAECVQLRNVRPIVITGRWRSASPARAAATDVGLRAFGGTTRNVWLASTDADCTVPSGWLGVHTASAQAGLDAIAGRVRLARSAPPAMRAAFAAVYDSAGAVNRHVHAANLGVRADAYLRAGGWRRSTVLGEDHDLWHRLTVAGCHLGRSPDLVVTTSHRLHSRVIGGFASSLAALARVADEASA